MAVLYIVATPIGNLEDITLRALRTLREVKLIAAEDTRKTRILLSTYKIKTPVTSYYEHNKLTKLDYIVNRLSEADVALVSEAGTPGISDPGYELIRAAVEKDIPVVPIPGPSVVISALTVSGLPADRFTYLGFPPRRASARRSFLESVASEPGTLIFLEAPHRLLPLLQDILAVLGDRRMAVCRELTKVYEEIFRGTVSQALAHFTRPRGEFTVLVSGKSDRVPALTDEVREQLRRMIHAGVTAREAVARTANETGLSKKELYQTWLDLKRR